MGILEKGLKITGKVVGSAALGAAGVAAGVLRSAANATGADGVSELIGKVQDKSLDTVRDMWTPEEEKTDEYYESQAMRSIQRANNAERTGESYRRKYEQAKKLQETKMNQE